MKKVVLIAVMLFVIVTISPAFNVQWAAVNPNISTFGNNALYGDLIGDIMASSMGSLGTALSAVVLLVVGIIALLLAAIFGPIMGGAGFPGIDQIVYNGVTLFDPNFINPPAATSVSLSGIAGIQNLIKQVYQTGYVVGGSIFVIGAMIIGIRLAVTSIASEKAYYKELIGKWIKGLVLLFTVHIIITAVFALNEMIVNRLYETTLVHNADGSIAVDNNGKPVTKLVFSAQFDPLSKVVGKQISGIIGKALDAITGKQHTTQVDFYAPGLTGLVWLMIARSVLEGDIIAAIVVAGLLGQTISLMITYFKRVIVCILLAAIAPYIVAVDFIRQLL